MPDNKTPDEPDSDETLEALPEDLGLEDEIRQLSRKVNTIMKNVEEANAAIRAIIKPEIETNATDETVESPPKNDKDEPPESA